MKTHTIIIALLLPFFISAQSITGKVVNNKNEPLIGANLYWNNTNIGASTDINGAFEIPDDKNNDRKLIVSYIGYTADTITVGSETVVVFNLVESSALDEVVVKSQRDGVIISNLNPIKTERLTKTELGKAACCDLAGCFETQSSVQPHTTNVITNSKELRILGLSGVYNQVLINGLPMIQGLSYTYGVSSIPGTMVDNIYIAKGANSVLQGYESISGQINVETKNPDDTDKLLLNLYLNSFLEKHVNVNFAYEIGDWTSLTALHTVQPASRVDKDKDDFMDLPLLTRYSLSNTFKYRNSGEWGWSSKLGIRLLNEKRVGGQLAFDPKTDEGSSSIYGQSVQLTQPEIWTKTGYRFDDVSNIAVNVSAYYQDQESYFGTVNYNAKQVSFYGNAQYEYSYKNHVLKTGTSLRYQDLNEDIAFTNTDLPRTYDGNYHRREVVPGVFAENAMNFFDYRLTWIAGIRVDHHNEFGTFFTPRTLIKAAITPQTVLRANIGTGWRTVNLFSENIGLLVSSRDIVIEENLLPEQAVNYGFNLTQKFQGLNFSGFLSADFYRTDFQNQIFPDYDTDPSKAIIKNYAGTSVGNGFQTELYTRLFEQVELKVGYNYLDVYRMNGETKEVLPFNAKHKLLGTFSFKPVSNKYHLDVNAHWYGKQRLPDTKSNPLEFQRPDFSDTYSVVGAQFTYNFNVMEWYVGCENIFDFRQEQPIASWENPFGPYFDTSSVWGPTRGREFYIGVRYYIKDKDI